ncbi:unnamed protein product, partial [Pylaiella littoralis]
LEVTPVGDVVLRRGDLPADSSADEPVLWAHRAVKSFDGKANGGLSCVVESWWERNVNGNRDGIPLHLTVSNGRWRVGRGRFCTVGQSPRP